MPDNRTMDVNLSYINLPTRNYPVNYLMGGTYIGDLMDNYQLGHFGGGIVPDPELIDPFAPIPPTPLPNAEFVGDVTTGYAPLTVNFTNLSTNANSYEWIFGDGGTSTQFAPTHLYTSEGF